MRKIFTNLYKRSDVFSCPHSAHFRFGGMVTPHHILNEKKCYPDGCIVFVWKCRLLDKGHACPKKIKHVGRLCFSCKEFFEDKYIQKPKLNISDLEFRKFKLDVEEFDYWLSSVTGKEVELDAVVRTIKPNFRIAGYANRECYAFLNWLAVFDSAYINIDLFDDTCFARISDKTQDRFRLADGDRISCRAVMNFDRGRMVFTRLHNMEVTKNGSEPEWSRAEADVATATASRIDIQTEKCLGCRFGCLIDSNGDSRRNGSRSLLCLAGQRLPDECVYPLTKYLEREHENK